MIESTRYFHKSADPDNKVDLKPVKHANDPHNKQQYWECDGLEQEE